MKVSGERYSPLLGHPVFAPYEPFVSYEHWHRYFYALPFVMPFWLSRPSWRLRLFLAGYVALSIVCIGLTGSRGSFISLMVCAAVIILRSRWRVPLLVLALLLVLSAMYLLYRSKQVRLQIEQYFGNGPLSN